MIAAGTAAIPIDHRHTIDSEAPTTVAMTMPTPMAIWKASSESQLQESAPITAPSRMLAAITCFQPSPIPKSFVICSRAPEMMPVS